MPVTLKDNTFWKQYWKEKSKECEEEVVQRFKWEDNTKGKR